MQTEMIKTPINHTSCTDFPVIQYADDTILIIPAEEGQIMHIKNLLLHYASFSGLKVNYSKSTMIAINTPETKMATLSAILGCQIGTLPITYLGLLLSLSRPRVEDYTPLLSRIENRLMRCSTLLSFGDKLVLVKSVFASMPIFFMSTLSIPKTVVNHINKLLRHCLWKKYGSAR